MHLNQTRPDPVTCLIVATCFLANVIGANLVAADGDSSMRATAAQADWTLLVYGHADHNLTSSLIIDMEEMEEAGSAAGFNIVVQADFDANAGPERLRGLPAELATGITRFLIQPDSDRSRISSPAVGRLPENNNMDSPNTLMDFIRWGV